MGLDKYGFPATAIANTILVQQENFGDSTKKLEEAWTTWIHYNPFDAMVAEKLASLYTTKLGKTDQQKEGAKRQLLERKLELVTMRAERYKITNFAP